MSLSITIDDSRFRAQLARFVDELGQDAREVVRGQTRLLLKQVIGFTPPKTLAQGRAAIGRDITRSMTPILLEDFPNAKMRERVKELAEKQDIAGLKSFLANTKSWRNWRVEPFSPSLHTSARNKRGRVTRSQRVFIPELARKSGRQFRSTSRASAWNKYMATMQGFAGRLKAAWGPAYEAVGGALPSWVKRHASPRGSVAVHFGDPKRPAIEFRNGAVGVGQLINPFRAAMRIRAKALAGDISRKLRDAKKTAGVKRHSKNPSPISPHPPPSRHCPRNPKTSPHPHRWSPPP